MKIRNIVIGSFLFLFLLNAILSYWLHSTQIILFGIISGAVWVWTYLYYKDKKIKNLEDK